MSGITLPAMCLCLTSGAALGVFYLLLKLVRLLLRGGRLCAALMDVVFCLVCGIVAFLCALVVDQGRLRMIQAALQGLGAWGVIVALGPWVSGGARRIRKASAWVWGLLLKPVRAVRRFLQEKRKKRRARRLEKKRQKKQQKQRARQNASKNAGKKPGKKKKVGRKPKKRKKPLEKLT